MCFVHRYEDIFMSHNIQYCVEIFSNKELSDGLSVCSEQSLVQMSGTHVAQQQLQLNDALPSPVSSVCSHLGLVDSMNYHKSIQETLYISLLCAARVDTPYW